MSVLAMVSVTSYSQNAGLTLGGHYQNVVALSGGFPEVLDIEYQRSFGPFYVALKPGVIVMLLWDYNDHHWPAYPAVRFGYDVFRIGRFKIGPQLELGYLYDPDVNVAYGAGTEIYSEKWRTDNSFVSFGPALRYDWRHLEVQLCAGLTIENDIEYKEEETSNGTSHATVVLPAQFLSLVRVSVGFAF